MDILLLDVLRTLFVANYHRFRNKENKKQKEKVSTPWRGKEREGKGKLAKQRGGKEGRLVGVRCLRMIQSKLTSHQPCHQQKSTEEKDERR